MGNNASEQNIYASSGPQDSVHEVEKHPVKSISLVVGILVLLGVVSIVSYKIGAIHGKTASSVSQKKALTTASKVLVTPTPAWKNEKIVITQETAVSGLQKQTIGIQIPPGWKMQAISESNNSVNTTASCPDYLITNSDMTVQLSLFPLCTNWSAIYYAWPENAVVVKEYKNITDGHTNYIVRYFDAQNNLYGYASGEKGEIASLVDAMIVSGKGQTFVPVRASMSISSTEESVLKTADSIISSLKLQ